MIRRIHSRDITGGLARAYFVSGGSEAVEAALKLARQYFVEIGQPGRTRIIARRQSYHGNTLGALSAGGNLARRALYAPLLSPAFSHVSPAFAYREQRREEDEAAYVRRLADELEAEFQRLGPDSVAAFIAEPLVGATTGCVPAPAGYFQAVREVCDRHGALLILDEIMCGMGRTGTMHAWEQEGVSPDLQTVAKGLGGGFQPIGALLVSRRVVEGLEAGSGAFQHGHTYQAHPVAAAAALAVQRVIAEDGLLDHVRAMGELLLSNLQYKSFIDFSADLLGPWAGFFTGWTYWFCWIITGIADVIAISAYAQFWWPDLPQWAPAIACVAVLLSLNLLT